MLLIINRIDGSNVGDANCCPAQFFDLGPHRRQDIYETPDTKDVTHIIIGGGGLFHSSFESQVNTIMNLGLPLICWSAGTNYHGVDKPVYNVDLNKFSLLGLRDNGKNFVPCVSCMSASIVPKKGYGVVSYMHKDNKHMKDVGFPILYNSCKSMKKVIQHLNFGETVITNTYHGYYWSVLLGKRVILFKPFSSKFYCLPWTVPVVWNEEELPDVINGPIPTYPNALDECRKLNQEFYNKVLALTTK